MKNTKWEVRECMSRNGDVYFQVFRCFGGMIDTDECFDDEFLAADYAEYLNSEE